MKLVTSSVQFSSMLKEAEALLPETLAFHSVPNKRPKKTIENTDYIYFDQLSVHSSNSSDTLRLKYIFYEAVDLVILG